MAPGAPVARVVCGAVLIVAACTPSPSTPPRSGPPPSLPTAATAATVVANAVAGAMAPDAGEATDPALEAQQYAAAHRRPRPGECRLDEAVRGLLDGATAIRCAEDQQGGAPSDKLRIRGCMLDAIKRRRAFTATFRMRGYDSTFEHAYVGRPTADGYEVRELRYDSCPSGCGDADPVWHGQVCSPMEDVRAACASRDRLRSDEDLRNACAAAADEEPRYPPVGGLSSKIDAWLGLWCNRPRPAGACPSPTN